MNKNLFWLVPICLLLGACEHVERDMLPQVKLPPLDEVVGCDKNGPKVITIVANKAQFSVAPPHLCVDGGDSIMVNFTGNHSAGTITLNAKPYIDAAWLTATNPGTNPDQATIDVPTSAGGEVTYFYNVTAIGWGTIDPMITVD